VAPAGLEPEITLETTEAGLIERFGARSVSRAKIHLPEMTPEQEPTGTVLFAAAPARRLEIIWQDEGTRARPALARARGFGTASGVWAVAPGITLGTTLVDIERMNGAGVRLTGFGWDYSGTIVDWRAGKLASLRTGAPRVFVRLAPFEATANKLASDYRQVLGDRDVPSDHPAMRALEPRVYSIELEFARR
jgi:hypothetical protein